MSGRPAHVPHQRQLTAALHAGLLLLTACAITPEARVDVYGPRDSNPTAGKGLAKNVSIHTWTAPADGFFASTHYLVTKEGVLVIDAQFLPEYADQLFKDIRKRTRRPVKAIYITHPHPDHYFGAGRLVELTSAELHATESTARHIEAEAGSKRLFWHTQYSARLPNHTTVPELTFSEKSPAGVGGTLLELHELELNESADSLIAYMPATGALFTGDLVFNGSHLWMAEGHSDRWIDQLEALKQYHATTIYPGHGAPGGPELIDQNLYYLRTVQGIVANYVDEDTPTLSATALEAIRAEVVRTFPGLANPQFLDLSIPAEFSRQSTALRSSPR